MGLPSPLPDNPLKWDGWKAYNSPNPYERLCLDFDANPSADQIEDHCRQLAVWWQKKLPLKNQPSNPLSQLLRSALDEAPKCIAEARTQLLNADERAQLDVVLRAGLRERAFADFNKYLSFSIAAGILTPDDEENLYRVGGAQGLQREDMKAAIDAELERVGGEREADVPPPAPAVVPPSFDSPAVKCLPGNASAGEFMRMLKLSKLSEEDMTDDQRDALCNMGESLGLTGGQAEDVIDEYLEMMSDMPLPAAPQPAGRSRPATPNRPEPAPLRKPEVSIVAHAAVNTSPLARAQEKQKFPNFRSTLGMEMLLVPSSTFHMGSNAPESAPNEQPITPTTLSCYYISRHLVTNALFERFDPKHRQKRAPWADGTHPVVYVNSLEAIRFCEWLTSQERRKYRLPTEAEWELAARGMDGRGFPWGEKLNRGDLANFADKNTTFAWRDPEIDDGFPETSPVGSYPRGASPFGAEDMAGNVWEWCLDFFSPYSGKDRVNPRTGPTGSRRIYRGGSWKSRSLSLRATARGYNTPDYSSNDVGFRVVCECE